jgi:phosphate transport system protein
MSQHLHRDVENLKRKTLALSAVVEESVRDALDSFLKSDPILAERVIVGDGAIDSREIEVEEDCLKILALHQPVAIDLRFIVSVLKINNDLERIADLAVNIGELTLFSHKAGGRPPSDLKADIEDMASMARSMLKRALDSLVNMDSALAREVLSDDDGVDAINARMYTQVAERVEAQPRNAETTMRMLMLSRHLERIADLATNIAEDVVYMIEGRIVRHGAEAPIAGDSDRA